MSLYTTLTYMSYNFYFLCILIKTGHDNQKKTNFLRENLLGDIPSDDQTLDKSGHD